MFPFLVNKVISILREGSLRRSVLGSSPRGRSINLALQGGGAHGAFTWGVLDQLLADGRLTIDGISGASAGAVNAVMLADGLARGGPELARARLAEFWRAASFGGGLPDLQRSVVERLFSLVPHHAGWLSAMPRFWSPYELNPLNINPLKELIERFVDFDALRQGERELFITATNVYTGAPRIFTRAEMSAEVIMASACLPLLFQAVEIDGIPYWDGGYSGNPVLAPFLKATSTEDVLIIQINPVERRKLPATNREIMDRISDISFNASLLAELRLVEFAGSLIDAGRLPHGTGMREYRRIRLHRVALEDVGPGFDAHTRLNTGYEFFERLRDLGRRAMQTFLDAHADDIGRRSTIDLPAPLPAVA